MFYIFGSAGVAAEVTTRTTVSVLMVLALAVLPLRITSRHDLIACRCNSSLLALFLEAYREQHLKMNSSDCCWLDPNKRLSSLPKAAMCYVLLHKQELISRIWKEFPDAWVSAKTWRDVEELLWAPLDVASRSNTASGSY